MLVAPVAQVPTPGTDLADALREKQPDIPLEVVTPRQTVFSVQGSQAIQRERIVSPLCRPTIVLGRLLGIRRDTKPLVVDGPDAIPPARACAFKPEQGLGRVLIRAGSPEVYSAQGGGGILI